MAYTCPKCEAEFYDRLKYCPECGFDFTAGQKRCPKCREQIALDSKICPACGLDFEQWAYFVPRMILTLIVLVIVLSVLVFPLVWKTSPWLHDKGTIVEGQLQGDVDGQWMIPMFIHWGSGERYIEKSLEYVKYGSDTDYLSNLIPLPPEVVFHYDLPIGERVWIIQRKHGATTDWVRIGRWEQDNGKFGWVHTSNILAE